MKSQKVKDDFIACMLETMGNISASCEKAHIARRTYYHWLEKDKKFAERVSEVTEGLVDFAESKLKQLMREGNPTAIIFYLKTKGKDRGYIEYKKVESENEIKVDLPKINLELVGGDEEE